MRILCIGDIHGCYQALTTLIKAVPIRDEDFLITLGDYIDRGPHSFEVLEWLVNRAKGGNQISLLGNHEKMILEAREDMKKYEEWCRNGGDYTLASYSPFGDSGKMDDIPENHWDFLNQECKNYYETKSHLFVHANAYPDMALADQPEYILFWESFNNPPPHESGKILVCGHTPQKSGIPLSLGHAICIDTWAYGNGWLTCLDVATGQYWQANQREEVRSQYLGFENLDL